MEKALSSVLGRSAVVYYCWWRTRVSLKTSRLDRPTDFLGRLLSFWETRRFQAKPQCPGLINPSVFRDSEKTTVFLRQPLRAGNSGVLRRRQVGPAEPQKSFGVRFVKRTFLDRSSRGCSTGASGSYDSTIGHAKWMLPVWQSVNQFA